MCVNVHIYGLYMYRYMYTHVFCLLIFFFFLWAEDGKKGSRELHNPINSCVGEVIYLI